MTYNRNMNVYNTNNSNFTINTFNYSKNNSIYAAWAICPCAGCDPGAGLPLPWAGVTPAPSCENTCCLSFLSLRLANPRPCGVWVRPREGTWCLGCVHLHRVRLGCHVTLGLACLAPRLMGPASRPKLIFFFFCFKLLLLFKCFLIILMY